MKKSKSNSHFFIFKGQPRSVNSKSKMRKNYKTIIKNSFSMFNNDFNSESDMLSVDLYGVVYYFPNHLSQPDADNISKPIWDSLSDFLFKDDKQVKLRIAGCFDSQELSLDELDLTGVPGALTVEIQEAFAENENIVYIECGKLNYNMINFNLVLNGNQ